MATKKKTTNLDLPSQSDPRAPLDGALFLSRAQGLLKELEADLLARARGSLAVREALRLRHETERAEKRTADPLEVWERHFVTQVAASWLLSCVFVRTLEDRGLLGHNRIAGPGAADSQRLFFEVAPSLTEREYLLTVFRELSRLPAARELFDARRNPVWLLGPSAEMAKRLLALFRAPNAEAPGLRFGQSDTRFLGDLYQDLSADVRERFALLQTPHFVEKYILDRTLERAIARFGLDETTLIDPTCGSGHFLLGAFERLLDHRLRKEPGLDVREAARRALDAVYGADINPYAVAIARFRLTLAFLEKAGYARIGDAPALPLHVVVGDSLLHAPQQSHLGDLPGQAKAAWAGDAYALEDEPAAKDVLFRRYTAVVGNPPYITVKDATLREVYRAMYPRSAAGKYSLGAPFTERFFLLARAGGFVGTITANSFMKREFGKKLIEVFLPTVNLDGVVNTSGAYIPGHGTPTVLLFGSNEPKVGDDVLAVLAKRGEPSTPDDPEQGHVWRSIADHGAEIGFDNEYVSVARVTHGTFGKHPWSLGGGGAAELKDLVESRAASTLGDMATVGIGGMCNADDVYFLPPDACRRQMIPEDFVRSLAFGEEIRDWSHHSSTSAIFPYSPSLALVEPTGKLLEFLWPFRTTLWARAVFSGETYRNAGRTWWEWHQLTKDRYRTPLSIIFAFVATHNHFVLDRGGKVFNRSAPIIKLKEGATEDDHLALLAYLNSSTACFWMKQVFYPKASASGDVSLEKGKEEANRYEFAGTQLATLPVPTFTPSVRSELTHLARSLSELAALRQQASGKRVVDEVSEGASAQVCIEQVECERSSLLAQMIVLQEDIDWATYHAVGLVPEWESSASTSTSPKRPFEAVSEDCPPSWQKRAKWLSSSANLQLIETRVHKRPWDGRRGVFGHNALNLLDEVQNAAVEWLAERCEVLLATNTAPSDRQRLSTELTKDERAVRVLELASGTSKGLADALSHDCVAFASAYRLTEAGLEKRAAWEHVWALQRAEDRGESVPPFEPAPKYDQKDYRDATTWRLRGKLDVPKERFISYPGCESDEDKEPVYGWAGWNHLQQAQALAALYQKRKTEESWGKERLTPMLAGLLELIPWVKQWHNDPSAEFGGLRLGDYFETFLDGECHTLGLTREALRAWRPAEKGRGKKAKATPGDDDATEPGGSTAPAKKPAKKRAKKTATPEDAAEGE